MYILLLWRRFNRSWATGRDDNKFSNFSQFQGCRPLVTACMCACVCACVRACMCMCVCACMRARVCECRGSCQCAPCNAFWVSSGLAGDYPPMCLANRLTPWAPQNAMKSQHRIGFNRPQTGRSRIPSNNQKSKGCWAAAAAGAGATARAAT